MTATDANLNRSINERAVTAGSDEAIALIKKPAFTARAIYVGEYIDLRHFVRSKRVIAQQPAITAVTGGGLAILYRYGAVVFFDASLSVVVQHDAFLATENVYGKFFEELLVLDAEDCR